MEVGDSGLQRRGRGARQRPEKVGDATVVAGSSEQHRWSARRRRVSQAVDAVAMAAAASNRCSDVRRWVWRPARTDEGPAAAATTIEPIVAHFDSKRAAREENGELLRPRGS
ncbi:hypothetical protein ACP70R_008189 [Stipagrostis hirtigluma subsp. patula]